MILSDPFPLLLVLVGPFVGSFLGVLADRLPRNEGVVLRRSACRHCKKPLSVSDLVPIVSYLCLRGACRSCGAPIPPWILYLEITAAGVAILAVLAATSSLQAWAWALFLWLLLVLSVCDLTRYRLPDSLTLSLFICAIALSMLPGGIGFGPALIGATAGVVSFAVLRWGYRALRGREGLGLGDIKLMAGLGAFAGPWELPLLVCIASVGALVAAVFANLARNSNKRSTPLALQALPFGAALCAAGAMLWLIRVIDFRVV